MHNLARTRIAFDGDLFGNLMEQLDGLNGDVKGAVNKCLEASAEITKKNLNKAMTKHHRTGKTEEAIIKNPQITWQGSKASVNIGFKFPEGLASVFLMYGTPRMKKDTKVYNAIYGKKTREEIAKNQDEILNDAIRRAMGG